MNAITLTDPFGDVRSDIADLIARASQPATRDDAISEVTDAVALAVKMNPNCIGALYWNALLVIDQAELTEASSGISGSVM